MKTIKERYQDLEAWAKTYTAELEKTIRHETRVAAFHCFVLDQFEDAFPEDHLSRDKSTVFIGLRLALDLQGLGNAGVALLKTKLEPFKNTLLILRDNFQDSALRIDFDWHVSEKEREVDLGQAFAVQVLSDCSLLSRELQRLAQ